MQAGMEGSINVNSAFSCRQCKKLPLRPIQNQCCTIIICDTCIGTNCYHCKKPCIYKKTPFLQHLYNCITVKCTYNCPKISTLSKLGEHMATCPEATMECPFCKDKNIKTTQFPDHMGSRHQQECSRLLIEFHKQKQQVKPLGQIKILSPFGIGTSKICKNGRIVCGGQLGISGASSSSGFFKSGFKSPACSLEEGSCNKCMKKDKERLGLTQNCLLNFAGRICYFSMEKKKLGCGIGCGGNGNPFICNGEYSCNDCQLTTNLIRRGLYIQFLK